MKVIHINWSLPIGGKERRMIQLIKGLNHKGFDQILVTFVAKNDYAGSFEDYCKYVVIEGNSKFERCRQFARIIKTEKPDVVHLWSDLPLVSLFIPVLKIRYGFKYVAGFVADAIPLKWSSFTCIAHHFTYPFADAIVSNSKAGLIAKKADYKKAHVIYNGFDFNRFKKEGFNKAAYKDSLGIKERFVATMAARFSPSKDYIMFVKMAKQLQDNPDVVFVAAGYGETQEECERYCKDNEIKNVRFLGYRTDMEEILMCSDFGILFTNDAVHAEGVSNSIMESMAAGMPVIATDGGGTPEIIEDGVSGYIVKPKDNMKAAEILKQLILDEQLRIHIGEAARQRIEDKFTLRAMTDEYMKLYASL